jgi:hypothetical protein
MRFLLTITDVLDETGEKLEFMFNVLEPNVDGEFGPVGPGGSRICVGPKPSLGLNMCWKVLRSDLGHACW